MVWERGTDCNARPPHLCKQLVLAVYGLGIFSHCYREVETRSTAEPVNVWSLVSGLSVEGNRILWHWSTPLIPPTKRINSASGAGISAGSSGFYMEGTRTLFWMGCFERAANT